jgi:hypothetical protein
MEPNITVRLGQPEQLSYWVQLDYLVFSSSSGFCSVGIPGEEGWRGEASMHIAEAVELIVVVGLRELGRFIFLVLGSLRAPVRVESREERNW